jgi:nitroimidazol reductase NimA-like FMN-containing flavoprotein (pyridoxamine 5'-phosphate oxidase superfamily)
MSDAEIQSFLREQKKIVLVSNGKNGFPHPVHMLYHCDENGILWMTSYAKAMKVMNLARDPRASLVVEISETYEGAKSVIVFARAEIIRDVEAVKRTFRAIASKGIPDVPAPIGGETADGRAAKRVALKFTPDSYISWDHAKLLGAY